MISKSACPDILLMGSIGVIKIWQLCLTQGLLLSYYLFMSLHLKFVVVIYMATDSNFQARSSFSFLDQILNFLLSPKHFALSVELFR